MSRFVYKVYLKEKYVDDFTSINQILFAFHNQLKPEERERLIKAFKIPAFTKIKPQTYHDESIELKVVSEYTEYTVRL